MALLVTIDRLAAQLDIPREVLEAEVQAGRLPHAVVGGCVVLEPDLIVRILTSRVRRLPRARRLPKAGG